MKLVIDIPEEMYQEIKETNMVISGRRNGKRIDYILFNAVDAGTPLPKGHGRLISEPTKEEIEKTVGGQNDFAECIRDSVKAVFDNAPTIIEADKEDEE